MPHLLHCCQALELCAAEVLLLQGCCLQHEVLLLGSIHLLQVLRRRAGLPVQGLLDHLRSVRGSRSMDWPHSVSSLHSCLNTSCPEKDPVPLPSRTESHLQSYACLP